MIVASTGYAVDYMCMTWAGVGGTTSFNYVLSVAVEVPGISVITYGFCTDSGSGCVLGGDGVATYVSCCGSLCNDDPFNDATESSIHSGLFCFDSVAVVYFG